LGEGDEALSTAELGLPRRRWKKSMGKYLKLARITAWPASLFSFAVGFGAAALAVGVLAYFVRRRLILQR